MIDKNYSRTCFLRKNRKLVKKEPENMPSNRLNALFYLVFYVCSLQLSQNTNVIFFYPIGLQNLNQIVFVFFLLFFFFTFSLSPKQIIEKIVYTFCSTLRNLKVKKIVYTFLAQLQNLKVDKNTREIHFEIVRLSRLKAYFIYKIYRTFDFSRFLVADLFF